MHKMEFEGLFKTCYMCSIRNRTTLQINAAGRFFFFFIKRIVSDQVWQLNANVGVWFGIRGIEDVPLVQISIRALHCLTYLLQENGKTIKDAPQHKSITKTVILKQDLKITSKWQKAYKQFKLFTPFMHFRHISKCCGCWQTIYRSQ